MRPTELMAGADEHQCQAPQGDSQFASSAPSAARPPQSWRRGRLGPLVPTPRTMRAPLLAAHDPYRQPPFRFPPADRLSLIRGGIWRVSSSLEAGAAATASTASPLNSGRNEEKAKPHLIMT